QVRKPGLEQGLSILLVPGWRVVDERFPVDDHVFVQREALGGAGVAARAGIGELLAFRVADALRGVCAVDALRRIERHSELVEPRRSGVARREKVVRDAAIAVAAAEVEIDLALDVGSELLVRELGALKETASLNARGRLAELEAGKAGF